MRPVDVGRPADGGAYRPVGVRLHETYGHPGAGAFAQWNITAAPVEARPATTGSVASAARTSTRWERRRGIARADAAATLPDVVADHTLARTAINVFGG
jgi:hypothetical protein